MARAHTKPRRWIADEIAYLRANYRKKPLAEIGEHVGRGVKAVSAMITKLGISFFADPTATNIRWLPEHDQFLRDNKDKGWQWCAEQMGRTPTSIHNRVRRLGINLKQLKRGDFCQIKKLHSQGLMTAEIGARLGVSDECIRRWLNQWGLPLNKRDEKKRMETLQKNLNAKYGVTTIALARKVRRRRLRQASMAMGAQKLAAKIQQR